MLKYLVAYASETGNTKKIAEEIYNAIPDSRKEIINVRSFAGLHEAENYFIGYWANCGTCSMEIIDLLSSLHGKNVAIFGTCGLGNTDAYYKKLELAATTWLPNDNQVLGSYFCQGRMPVEFRQKYEACRGKCSDEQLRIVIDAYDKAKSHPDRQDLLRAHVFASDVIKRINNDLMR